MYKSISLNGTWEMSYTDKLYNSTEFPEDYLKSSDMIEDAIPGYWEDMTENFRHTAFFHRLRINPDYAPQSYPLSRGIADMRLPNYRGSFFYRRSIVLYDTVATTICFEGVQNTASLWINGVYIGTHRGYSTPFEMQIPDGVLINGTNTLVMAVSNYPLEGNDGEFVSGLTNRAVNEYTGGITGDVEFRIYNSPIRDVHIKISPDLASAFVVVESQSKVVCEWNLTDDNHAIKSGCSLGDFEIDITGLELWSPENPKLYTLEIRCGDASVKRKFGIRRLISCGSELYLNGKAYFLRGICEHCYYPETVHPTHDIAYYKKVIKTIKKLGFNFIRFHTHIPPREYMQAADELGILLHVECPNNTSYSEWGQIVKFCRRYTSVVIYCCGNEVLMDEPFIEYLSRCADAVHNGTDALFSPVSALRGLEYAWNLEPGIEKYTKEKPLKHHPGRFELTGKFSDVYSSYSIGHFSYYSTDADSKKVDSWYSVYQKPRLTHEICIDGTYADLSLKDRYKGTRIGDTNMLESIEAHLKAKGILDRAPLYFRNSSYWQQRIRKYAFEAARMCRTLAGFDFLGPIDTHWHTFGYDVGMMNEFYELKPGETARNVLMYNSPVVILTDIGKRRNYLSASEFKCKVYLSNYGGSDLKDGRIRLSLISDGKVLNSVEITKWSAQNGAVSCVGEFCCTLPEVGKGTSVELQARLESGDTYSENCWEMYIFPECGENYGDICVSNGMEADELFNRLSKGEDVLILGTKPFTSISSSFRIALAGRNDGNLATVINEHPIMDKMPHDGFCGWQFASMLEGGAAVCFESDEIPFNPIVEVASSHKYAIRQAALFEFGALNGRLVVCGFNVSDEDPGASWLVSQIVSYMKSESFAPQHTLGEDELGALINNKVVKAETNKNFAFNINDKAALRRRRR